MALYYVPVLIRSDRYFVAKLDEQDTAVADFNFVVPVDDRIVSPLLTIEDPSRVVLTQMAPSDKQDIPLQECAISFAKREDGVELIIKKMASFSVEENNDAVTGLRLDYSPAQKKISLNYYKQDVATDSLNVYITLQLEDTAYTAKFNFAIVPAKQCQRVVIDFGSEASQIGYKNGGPQSSINHYDILENIVGKLRINHPDKNWQRESFLNNETGQNNLYRTFYAVKKNIGAQERENFPFNFTDDISNDEIRLFITREEVSATQVAFRDNYEIVPNLKLGIEKSLHLKIGTTTEDYSIQTHKKELISGILLRMLRLMIGSKPEFRRGGIIVSLLVPNIYTQQDVFELLNELRKRTDLLLQSLDVDRDQLYLEYETISESDAAFMGYQQTNSGAVRLNNGDMALVIDCGKGTTDISMLIADENENYASFFRTGFAGAGNVLSYALVEDFLTLVLRAIPGTNDRAIRDFIAKEILAQNLTGDVLNFLQWIEDQKKRYKNLSVIGINAFGEITEQAQQTERSVGNLHRDPSNLLRYATAILKDRNIRWDDEVTGIVDKAITCIVGCIVSSIKDVMTKDVKKRIKLVMLSGRAFYFESLRLRLEEELKAILGSEATIHTMPPNRMLNNKNVAIHGAFTGAYKITDFTGMPIDRKEGLSRNNDVLKNNIFLYRGIKIQPGNDILYNTAIVRRNNQQLKSFKNKTVDIFFTRDNIYLRLLENQQVKDVRSLYHVLTSGMESYFPVRDIKAISMFPSFDGELSSINELYEDIRGEEHLAAGGSKNKKRKSVFHLFHF